MVILPVGRSQKTVQSSFSKAQTVPFVTYVDAKKQEVTRVPFLRALYPCTLELLNRKPAEKEEVFKLKKLQGYQPYGRCTVVPLNS